MRIANVDMRNNQSQCPPGLVYIVTEGRRLCRKPSLAPGCSSTTFTTLGTKYTKVCGKIVAMVINIGQLMDLIQLNIATQGTNETYVDGVTNTWLTTKTCVDPSNFFT